ncbi:MAG: HDOD domain-containing protein [Acidimicrobiia bacterium]
MTKHPSLQRLIHSLEELPSHRGVAVRVVLEMNKPTASAYSVAPLIELDPALTTLVLRLANSAYYGLRHRVSSAQRAIAVVGFENVRTFATARAAGALESGADSLPPGMWEHAVETAAAASVVAPLVGARREDAFSVGLLHDIGQMVLYRLYPDEYIEVMARAIAQETTLMGAEISAFGFAHDDVGAAVLHEWGFPRPFTQAIQFHHQKEPNLVTPLVKALAAGQDLSLRLPDAPIPEVLAPAPLQSGMQLAGIEEYFAEDFMERTQEAARDLFDLLVEPA